MLWDRSRASIVLWSPRIPLVPVRSAGADRCPTCVLEHAREVYSIFGLCAGCIVVIEPDGRCSLAVFPCLQACFKLIDSSSSTHDNHSTRVEILHECSRTAVRTPESKQKPAGHERKYTHPPIVLV
ncbi:hypothetical protein BDZ89DRAFT_550146 [Hymenopellis radicata]|nr:hypothetical protein BDZ89DRAFT_550146 [Hymenopellis radicata]